MSSIIRLQCAMNQTEMALCFHPILPGVATSSSSSSSSLQLLRRLLLVLLVVVLLLIGLR